MSASDSRQGRYANNNANPRLRSQAGWGSDQQREYRPVGGPRFQSVLVPSGAKRKPTGPTAARKPVPRPVNLPSQRKDRHADGSPLVNKPSRQDENTSHQPDSHTQTLKPHTWQGGSSASWTNGQEPAPGRDEYGFPRAEAPINTRDFPSLAATAKQPLSKPQRSQPEQEDPYFTFDDRGGPPPEALVEPERDPSGPNYRRGQDGDRAFGENRGFPGFTDAPRRSDLRGSSGGYDPHGGTVGSFDSRSAGGYDTRGAGFNARSGPRFQPARGSGFGSANDTVRPASGGFRSRYESGPYNSRGGSRLDEYGFGGPDGNRGDGGYGTPQHHHAAGGGGAGYALMDEDYIGPMARVLDNPGLISSTLLAAPPGRLDVDATAVSGGLTSGMLAGNATTAVAAEAEVAEEDGQDDRAEYLKELEKIKQENEERQREKDRAAAAAAAAAAEVEVSVEEEEEGTAGPVEEGDVGLGGVAAGSWEDAEADDTADVSKSGLKPVDLEKWQRQKAEQEAAEADRIARAAAKLRELEEQVRIRDERARAFREASEAIALAGTQPSQAPPHAPPAAPPSEAAPPPPPQPDREPRPYAAPLTMPAPTSRAAEAPTVRPTEVLPAPAPFKPAWNQPLFKDVRKEGVPTHTVDQVAPSPNPDIPATDEPQPSATTQPPPSCGKPPVVERRVSQPSDSGSAVRPEGSGSGGHSNSNWREDSGSRGGSGRGGTRGRSGRLSRGRSDAGEPFTRNTGGGRGQRGSASGARGRGGSNEASGTLSSGSNHHNDSSSSSAPRVTSAPASGKTSAGADSHDAPPRSPKIPSKRNDAAAAAVAAAAAAMAVKNLEGFLPLAPPPPPPRSSASSVPPPASSPLPSHAPSDRQASTLSHHHSSSASQLFSYGSGMEMLAARDSSQGLSSPAAAAPRHKSQVLSSPAAAGRAPDFDDGPDNGGEDLLPSNILGMDDDTPMPPARAQFADPSAAGATNTTSSHTSLLSPPLPDAYSSFSPAKPQQPSSMSHGNQHYPPPPPHAHAHPHAASSTRYNSVMPPSYGAPPADPSSLWATPTTHSWNTSLNLPPHHPNHHEHSPATNYANPHGGHPQQHHPQMAPSAPSGSYESFAYSNTPYNMHPRFPTTSTHTFSNMPLVPTSKPPDWSNTPSVGWGNMQPAPSQTSHEPHNSPQPQFPQVPQVDTNSGVYSRQAPTQPMAMGRRGVPARRSDVESQLPDNLGLGTSPPVAAATASRRDSSSLQHAHGQFQQSSPMAPSHVSSNYGKGGRSSTRGTGNRRRGGGDSGADGGRRGVPAEDSAGEGSMRSNGRGERGRGRGSRGGRGGTDAAKMVAVE